MKCINFFYFFIICYNVSLQKWNWVKADTFIKVHYWKFSLPNTLLQCELHPTGWLTFISELKHKGWFIKNATGLIILLKMNNYSTFSARFMYNWILWDIKSSKGFVIHFGLPNWLILSIFQHFKKSIYTNLTKLKKVIAIMFWNANFDPD